MSGSIGRSYLIQSWNDAASYSGEQIGQRLKESTDLYLANGKANIGLFEEKPKEKAKTKSAFDSIMLADRHYSRLCGLSEQLDAELDQGQIDLESWAAARRNIDKRLEKAWERVCKERPELLEGTPMLPHSLDFTLDTEALRSSQVDMSIIPKHSVFHSLKDDNLFKIGYSICLTMVNKLSKLWNVGKQILEEGLI